MERSPKFSIVIASKLSLFKNSATDRETKFICAIESCLIQTFTDFEVIILGDSCDITERIYNERYSTNNKIRFFQCIAKGDTWSRVSLLRNYGIEKANGKWITYLDTDDILGRSHLQILSDEIKQYQWIWYDDYITGKDLIGKLNRCELKFGKIGTCNVTHRKDLGVQWSDKTYKHDFKFIGELMRFPNYTKAATPEYFICHQPGKFDV